MIIVKNRELLIPNHERYIGTTYDTESENRQFLLSRFAQNGVDLSALTFRLDLKYANDATDTVVLDKEVTDTNIILTWNIGSSVLQVPGTLFIQLRAADDEVTVKWSSFHAALYVERHLNTPGNYTGSLTEIEQIEQDHQYMKGVVDELKSHLDYTHEAEAWAIGKKDGEDVPSTDETYHNNSKYYSEQAGASKNAAASSATAAANSATQAAATVADTNTRFKNAVAAVTSETEVIDARVGADGTQYTVLKDRLDAEHTDVKSAKVDKTGIGQVTPHNLQIVDASVSPNLIDESALLLGKFIVPNGTISSGNYNTTDYIAVVAGEKYCLSSEVNGTRGLRNLKWVACYNANKEIMASSGLTDATSPVTIPADVSYIRFSYTNYTTYTKWQFEHGTVATAYYPFNTSIDAKIRSEYLPEIPVSTIEAFELVQGQNLLNRDDPDFLTEKYIAKSGAVSTNTAFVASGYIAVSPGESIVGGYKAASGNTVRMALSYIACYDSTKTVMPNVGVNAYNNAVFVVPDGVAFVRISLREGTYGQYLQIEKSDSNYPKPYVPYEEPHYELKQDYMYPLPGAPEYVYLPSDLYVAVGRTIELYNSQVVLDHEKYHFQWVCTKGKAFSRKFSITGETAGNVDLILNLYNDKKELCWTGRCVIHVVAASNPIKKILPIGDSLTNWKPYLPEVMLLSGQNITWVGTRYSGASVDSAGNSYASGTIHHEGRSGWGASSYLSNATYSFDTRYDGVSSVSGSANPFWDGSKFSLAHYLTTQTGVDTPDAVQIFLGTNDITTSVDDAITNITAMVNNIRAEYPSMPIFVCNTIYRSNQNGYGSTGGDAYAGGSGANAWQYDQDSKVMDLMTGLSASLKGVSGVYLVPLATCMDREYDFGQVATPVNPRCAVTVDMPAESVHPQPCGYYQMADVMYSAFCGVLT